MNENQTKEALEAEKWPRYRQWDGALLLNCSFDDESQFKITSKPYPHCREIGDWPFFNKDTNCWEVKKEQRVTPSYAVTMMFHPNFHYSCHALIIPTHVPLNQPYFNPVSDLFDALRKKIEVNETSINLSCYIYEEILNLNSFLQDRIYSDHSPVTGLVPIGTFQRFKVNGRIIFSTLRQILLALLCSFFAKEGKLNPYDTDDYKNLLGKDDIKTKYPFVNRYNKLFMLVADVDNCLKHEFLERRINEVIMQKSGIQVVKFNRCTHFNFWNLNKKDIDCIDNTRKEFWTYSVEYDALITEFSRFLCDFLEIKDSETDRRPPVFSQIQEKWSLAGTLPKDKKDK